ncbi:MAG: WecB/TagA/CpsF family glycosyltransferase [Phycisphaerales bacterium]
MRTGVDGEELPQPVLGERRRVMLMGLPLDSLTESGAVDRIMAGLAAGRGGTVYTPNLHNLRLCSFTPVYAEAVKGASLSLADGMPLIWASRLRGTPLPERVAGSELIWSLTARAAMEARSVFLIGGNPGAADAAATKFRSLHQGLRVVGTMCPPLGFERDEAYLMEVERALASAAPDICYVGLNFEKQVMFIERFGPRLPRTWFLGIGISFSYVSGEVRHAPPWMRRVGLEWAFRLAQEPRRLARRYLLEGVPFGVRLLARALLERWNGRRTADSGGR